MQWDRQMCTHIYTQSQSPWNESAATPFEIWFWTALLWWRGRTLDSVVGGTASNSGVCVCVCVCVCVRADAMSADMSTHTPTVRSEVADIKCSHIAIHDILFESRDCQAWQSDTWSDGFWNNRISSFLATESAIVSSAMIHFTESKEIQINNNNTVANGCLFYEPLNF